MSNVYENGVRCANYIITHYGFRAAYRDMRDTLDGVPEATRYVAGQLDALLLAVTCDERLGVSRS